MALNKVLKEVRLASAVVLRWEVPSVLEEQPGGHVAGGEKVRSERKSLISPEDNWEDWLFLRVERGGQWNEGAEKEFGLRDVF